MENAKQAFWSEHLEYLLFAIEKAQIKRVKEASVGDAAVWLPGYDPICQEEAFDISCLSWDPADYHLDSQGPQLSLQATEGLIVVHDVGRKKHNAVVLISSVPATPPTIFTHTNRRERQHLVT